MAATNSRAVDVLLDDQTPHKWIIPMKEDAFQGFISKPNPSTKEIFGDGSLFSPMLFGKFFDPSDAFPLWEFEAFVLLAKLRESGLRQVDWFKSDKEYVLKAELPTGLEDKIQVSLEKGKVLEITGQWKPQADFNARDWRSSEWWEHGCVRRIELPENADWKKTEAILRNGVVLEIIIPAVNS